MSPEASTLLSAAGSPIGVDRPRPTLHIERIHYRRWLALLGPDGWPAIEKHLAHD